MLPFMSPAEKDDLRRLLEAAETAAHRLDQAAINERDADLAYRATPDGLGESLRKVEIAQRSGADVSTIESMLRRHVQAEQAAAAEYRDRTSRWGHGQWDGLLYACPTGDDEPFTQWAIDQHITGTYRVHPEAQGTVKVTIARALPNNRYRRTWVLHTPGSLVTGSGITLLQVFTLARADQRQQAKLDRLLSG